MGQAGHPPYTDSGGHLEGVVPGKDHKIAIGDLAPHSRFPDSDGVRGGYIGDKYGPFFDLKLVKARQQGSATYKHKCREEIESKAIFGFHRGK